MPAVFEHALTVGPGDLDELRHVNNLRYFSWLQAAAWGHSAAQGWTPARMAERGWAWVIRSQAIDYFKPALDGDAIVVRTWVADMEKTRTRREFRVHRGEGRVLIASARMVFALVDPARGRVLAIPAELTDAFEIVSDEP